MSKAKYDWHCANNAEIPHCITYTVAVFYYKSGYDPELAAEKFAQELNAGLYRKSDNGKQRYT